MPRNVYYTVEISGEKRAAAIEADKHFAALRIKSSRKADDMIARDANQPVLRMNNNRTQAIIEGDEGGKAPANTVKGPMTQSECLAFLKKATDWHGDDV